jgi:apolipoprotein N-acyltransferase
VTKRLPVFAADVLIGTLASPGPRTLYTALGDWPGMACTVAVLLLVLLALRRARAAPGDARAAASR